MMRPRSGEVFKVLLSRSISVLMFGVVSGGASSFLIWEPAQNAIVEDEVVEATSEPAIAADLESAQAHDNEQKNKLASLIAKRRGPSSEAVNSESSNTDLYNPVTLFKSRERAYRQTLRKQMEKRYSSDLGPVQQLRRSTEHYRASHTSLAEQELRLTASAQLTDGGIFRLRLKSHIFYTMEPSNSTIHRTERQGLGFELIVGAPNGRDYLVDSPITYYDAPSNTYMMSFQSFDCPSIISAFLTNFLVKMPVGADEPLVLWALETDTKKWKPLTQASVWSADQDDRAASSSNESCGTR